MLCDRCRSAANRHLGCSQDVFFLTVSWLIFPLRSLCRWPVFTIHRTHFQDLRFNQMYIFRSLDEWWCLCTVANKKKIKLHYKTTAKTPHKLFPDSRTVLPVFLFECALLLSACREYFFVCAWSLFICVTVDVRCLVWIFPWLHFVFMLRVQGKVDRLYWSLS